jgi:hypothetical protein
VSVRVQYRVVDFLSGMMAKATSARNVKKGLSENPGWEPFLLCDGPHMLGPVLILRLVLRFVCRDCGADLDDKMKVCPKCGRTIERGSAKQSSRVDPR